MNKHRTYRSKSFWLSVLPRLKSRRSWKRWLCFALAIVTAWFCIELERPPAFGAVGSFSDQADSNLASEGILTLPQAKTSLRSSLALGDVSPRADQAQLQPQQQLRAGQSLYETGRFTEALSTWKATLPLLETDPPRQAIALTLMALAEIELGQWDNAQISLDRAQALWPRLEDRRTQSFIQGKYWATQGRLELAKGQLANAYQAYQAAEAAYGAAGDTWGNLQSRLNQVKMLRLQGFGTQAFNNIQRWLPEVAALPDNALKATALREVAETWAILGDREQAKTYGSQSLELAKSLNLGAEVVKTLLSLGHLNWDRPLQSFNYFTQALQAATDFPDLQLQSQVNLIRLGLRFPRSASQLAGFYTGLQENLQTVPLSRARVFARLNLAETLLQYPNRNEIFAINDSDFQTLLNQALEDSEALADGRLQAYTLGVLGTFEEHRENLIQAQDYTEQALLITQQLNDPVGLYQWQWQLGRVLVAEEQWSQARETYAQTLETLEGLRTDLANLSTDLNFSFEEKIDPVYRQYVELLLTPDPGLPLSQDRLQTARNTIESLQVEELVSFFKANCVSAQSIDIETLDASAVVIYPILLRDSLEIIVGFPGQPLQHYQSSVTRGTLERAAQLLRLALAESSSPQRWRRSAAGETGGTSSQAVRLTRYIYDALIQPIAADLKASGAKTLVFTLDGALRNIPMGVLSDGERYLLEDYAIAVSPGLQLMETKPIDLTNLQVLIGGVTEGGAVEVEGTGQRSQIFSPLPFVKNEVYGIQQSIKSVLLLNDGQTLTVPPTASGEADRGAAVEGNGVTSALAETDTNTPKLIPQGAFEAKTLLKELGTGKFPIVHFATHGQFTSNVDETFILAWNDTLTLDELKALLQPIDRSTTAQPLELLVLSACQTALGDNRAALGLAGMAVRSGARSTLASLWSVDDQATAELMQAFYQNLVEKRLPRAEALRQAQLSLLNSENHSIPYFWAPFILVGSWL